jgi:hypothetical protein
MAQELIADGIVRFLRERKEAGKATPPFVIRLRGTGENEAREIVSRPLHDHTDISDIQINGATDLDNIQYVPDLKAAATEATRLASKSTILSALTTPTASQPLATLSPVVFSQDGQYERTAGNIMVKEGAKVLIMGTGKAVGTPSVPIAGLILSLNSTTPSLKNSVPTSSAPPRPTSRARPSSANPCSLPYARLNQNSSQMSSRCSCRPNSRRTL